MEAPEFLDSHVFHSSVCVYESVCVKSSLNNIFGNRVISMSEYRIAFVRLVRMYAASGPAH